MLLHNFAPHHTHFHNRYRYISVLFHCSVPELSANTQNLLSGLLRHLPVQGMLQNLPLELPVQYVKGQDQNIRFRFQVLLLFPSIPIRILSMHPEFLHLVLFQDEHNILQSVPDNLQQLLYFHRLLPVTHPVQTVPELLDNSDRYFLMYFLFHNNLQLFFPDFHFPDCSSALQACH